MHHLVTFDFFVVFEFSKVMKLLGELLVCQKEDSVPLEALDSLYELLRKLRVFFSSDLSANSAINKPNFTANFAS